MQHHLVEPSAWLYLWLWPCSSSHLNVHYEKLEVERRKAEANEGAAHLHTNDCHEKNNWQVKPINFRLCFWPCKTVLIYTQAAALESINQVSARSAKALKSLFAKEIKKTNKKKKQYVVNYSLARPLTHMILILLFYFSSENQNMKWCNISAKPDNHPVSFQMYFWLFHCVKLKRVPFKSTIEHTVHEATGQQNSSLGFY